MYIGFKRFVSDYDLGNASLFYAHTEYLGALETNCPPHYVPAGGNNKNYPGSAAITIATSYYFLDTINFLRHGCVLLLPPLPHEYIHKSIILLVEYREDTVQRTNTEKNDQNINYPLVR
jgi:hypothetical protein